MENDWKIRLIFLVKRAPEPLLSATEGSGGEAGQPSPEGNGGGKV